MKEIKEVIVVEGKTDTALLKSMYKVDTIETNGLALNPKTLALIKTIQKERGVIILTDPDYPGMKIRQRINETIPECKNAFVAKKDAIGKKKLGIAEARKEAINDALENVVTFSKPQASISWAEFLSLDIVGNKEKRLQVYQAFHLGYGNVKTLYKRLNMAGITKEQILKEMVDL